MLMSDGCLFVDLGKWKWKVVISIAGLIVLTRKAKCWFVGVVRGWAT